MTAGAFEGVERRGLMFVLSSPSGAGKSTLSRMLIERTPGLKMSVSATTRPMRPGEVNGRDYFFVDKPRFEAMAGQGELLECGILAGTSSDPNILRLLPAFILEEEQVDMLRDTLSDLPA